MSKVSRLVCVLMLSSIECCPRAGHSGDRHESKEEQSVPQRLVNDEKSEGHKKTGHDEDHKSNGHNDEKPGHEGGEHKERHGEDERAHEEGEEHEEGEHGEEEEASSSVGLGKAVTEAIPDKGFKLSEKALKALEIQTRPIRSQGSLSIPGACLVEFRDEAGVYRLRDGYFKLIEGTAQKQGRTVLFKPRSSAELRSGDQVVTNGVPLLRVAELDAFSEGEAGHAD